MLRLLALAAHFSPLNPGPFDPVVVDMLNAYFEPATRSKAEPDSVARVNETAEITMPKAA